MARYASLFRRTDRAQFSAPDDFERPVLHIDGFHPHRGAAVHAAAHVDSHSPAHPSAGESAGGAGRGNAAGAAGAIAVAAGAESGTGGPQHGPSSRGGGLVLSRRVAFSGLLFGVMALDCRCRRDRGAHCAAVASSRKDAGCGGSGFRELQRLCPLRRRLPLWRHHHGRADRRPSLPPTGPGGPRPLHQVRHLHRVLPHGDAVPAPERPGRRSTAAKGSGFRAARSLPGTLPDSRRQ